MPDESFATCQQTAEATFRDEILRLLKDRRAKQAQELHSRSIGVSHVVRQIAATDRVIAAVNGDLDIAAHAKTLFEIIRPFGTLGDRVLAELFERLAEKILGPDKGAIF